VVAVPTIVSNSKPSFVAAAVSSEASAPIQYGMTPSVQGKLLCICAGPRKTYDGLLCSLRSSGFSLDVFADDGPSALDFVDDVVWTKIQQQLSANEYAGLFACIFCMSFAATSPAIRSIH
jgi:hypothetical protein